jgi:cytochrome c biogenesis protein CcdA
MVRIQNRARKFALVAFILGMGIPYLLITLSLRYVALQIPRNPVNKAVTFDS